MCVCVSVCVCVYVCVMRVWIHISVSFGAVARASDSQLRVYTEFRIMCCHAKPGAILFTLHCSSSLRCMNEYLAIDSGGYLCTNTLQALVAPWLDASLRSRDGDRLHRHARK